MGTALALRSDFDGAALRHLARRTKDANQARRFLALAVIYGGAARSQAAQVGIVTAQIVRDWVIRFKEYGTDGLINGKAPGHPSKLNDTQRKALTKLVETGPIPAVHGVVRSRRKDLAQ